MTLPTDTELLPPSGATTRLPSLGSPELSVEYLRRVKEILEAMLGRRGGNDWDRVVTFRDLHQMGLEAGSAGGIWFNMGAVAPDPASPAFQQLAGRLTAEIVGSAAFRNLKTRIGSAEDMAQYPEEIRRSLSLSLDKVARERQAAIVAVEEKVQSVKLSLASRLDEITASLERTSAGIRKFDVAYADRTQAIALEVTQLRAELDGVGAIQIEERFQAMASEIDGLQGQWVVKIQTNDPANPIMAGLALAVEDPIAGPGTSSFIFMAEKFGFVTQNGNAIPFSIVGDQIEFNGNVRINGQLVIDAGGLQPGFEAPDTLNSALVPSISAAQAAADAADAKAAAMASLTLSQYGITVLGNTLTKTGGTANQWDASARSTVGHPAAIASAMPANFAYMAFGLNRDPASSNSWESMDYALEFLDNGTVTWMESGTVGSAITTYTPNVDTFTVEVDGAYLVYKKNGIVIWGPTPNSNTEPLYFDSSFYTAGGSLKNVKFSAMTSKADRLSKNAADILTGPIALQANGAVLVGSLTTDANGYRTGGYGVGITQRGMAAYNSAGVVTFQLDFAGGNPYFAGQLSAAYGTFGAVSIAAGGSLGIGATGYNTDTGIWLGWSGGNPKMSIRTANGSTFLCDPANNVLSMNGGTIGGATVIETFSATIPAGPINGSGAAGYQSYGSRTVSVTGPFRGALSYSWLIANQNSANGYADSRIIITGGSDTSSVSLAGTAGGPYGNDVLYGELICIVTDGSNLSKRVSVGVNRTHGTGAL